MGTLWAQWGTLSASLWSSGADPSRSRLWSNSLHSSSANVFVYNIPPEWTDGDLVREFGSCGAISTTRVIIDSQTNQSKGYGFVSFHEVRSAMKACDTMDGFMTSTGRRLKVQIKKGEEEAAAQALGIPVSQVKAHADHGGSGNRATPY